MKKEIFINMEKEVFIGDVLDIGFENHGIVYNLYKKYNEVTAVEYINGKEEKFHLKEGGYDSCVMLFSFNDIWFKKDKRKLLKEIFTYLKRDGYIYIWDVDKGFKSTYIANIKIFLPERKIREIKIRDINILKDNSKENMLKLMEENFDIVDFKVLNNIYYIKGKKKGCNINEGCADSG